MRRLLLGTVAIAVMGCGSPASSVDPPGTGAVIGHALAGPTCPVAGTGGPDCEVVPVAGTVEFRQGGRIIASVPLDANGAYSATLEPGTYQASIAVQGRTLPVCPEHDASVVGGRETVLSFSCDTGIR